MTSKPQQINVALVGLGPHARRIYYPFLASLHEEGKLSIKLVVDLENKKDTIREYLHGQPAQPDKILLLNTKEQIHPLKTDPEFDRLLDELNITHVIISSEPKSHKAYLTTCIKKSLAVLVDKPITSPAGLMSSSIDQVRKASNQIVSDVTELINLSKQYPASRVLVQAQRRNHEGYSQVLKCLNDVVAEYGVPITYINIHHSDGMWNMPDEYFSRENHPYKYGYGKLMHSGYHFVDLLTRIEGINRQLTTKRPDSVSVFNQFLRPIDHISLVQPKDYETLFSEKGFAQYSQKKSLDVMSTFGELDNYSQIQFSKGDKVVTTAQMSLMQSGFSQRSWTELPKDTYKSNGRVRHESVNIHVGPLLNLQVHSYQESQEHEYTQDKQSVGGKDHFDIYIFRNSNLLGGKPFELIKFGDRHAANHRKSKGYLGHNEHARLRTLRELLGNSVSESELSSHLVSVSLTAAICYNQGLQQQGLVPYSKYTMSQLRKGLKIDA